jgi:hypothetical protein
MATTGMQIFEMAMALSDNLSAGVADSGENADFKSRIVSIINSCLPELYPYSTGASVTAGRRPVPRFLTALSETVDLDDALARGVLVHGVLALLLVGDNPMLASVHEQKYQEKLARLRNIPADWESITDHYGVLPGAETEAFAADSGSAGDNDTSGLMIGLPDF